MIAVDTNLLVYAHREDSHWHGAAYGHIAELAEGRAPWAIPWPCLHEFVAIVTHPKIYAPPSSVNDAIDQVDAWLESPSLMLLVESEGYWRQLKSSMQAGRIAGPLVHDAHVAALCVVHEVSELWSADRDFGRFAGLKVRNPLIA
jgi:uncharacterized protein